MKLVSYKNNGQVSLGILIDDKVYNLSSSASACSMALPDNMLDFLIGGSDFMNTARTVVHSISTETDKFISVADPVLVAPIPNPPSCRDAYAFRQHVATARRNRGVDMIPEFDQYPVFYFTNHNAISGGGIVEVEADHMEKLDFELEAAIIIGKHGKNIEAKDADEYIAGFTIMNDLSARVLQMEEMKLNLGPAKGKDFSTTIGPWLVTSDELEECKIETEFGNKYDLSMKAFHNGKQISSGNFKDMNWTFGEIIERVSYGVEIFPGDVIGSGTVGTGCYLELNGTAALEAKASGEEFNPIWLKDSDNIELEIDRLGKLSNQIKLSETKRSILAKKKIAETV